MNQYADIIKTIVAAFDADLNKTNLLAQNLIDANFSKDVRYKLFSNDSDVSYSLGENNPLARLQLIYKNRLIETYWNKFFTEIELYAQLGSNNRDKVTEKYNMKYSRFGNPEEVEFTVDNLTRFVDAHLKLDEEKYNELPKKFLLSHTGSWKNRKTQYSTRLTVNTFTDGNFISDYTQHNLCELVAMISHKLYNNQIAVKEIKGKIGHRYGLKEIECNLIEGVDFKLKPNGNAELKLSKVVVEFLNNSL